MANNHGLRTTGRHTGNWGRPKVKGNRGQLDLTPAILQRDDMQIPRRDEAFTRLQEAYHKTDDPRLKATLAEMLKDRERQVQQREASAPARQELSEYWAEIKRTR
jgi:hypothetical protein